MTRLIRSLFSLAVVLFLLSFPALAQLQIGAPPFGSYGGGPETINLANLNAHWVFPVLHKSGRGVPFNFFLTYDTSVWQPVASGSSTTWTPVSNWGWDGSELKTGYMYRKSTIRPCGGGGTVAVNNWSYVDGFGTVHPFGITLSGTSSCAPTVITGVAKDGSGYAFNISGSTVQTLFGPDGRTLLGVPIKLSIGYVISGTSSVIDRNGNLMSVDGSGNFYDTLSSTTPVLTQAGSGTASSPTTFSYAAPGATATYTVKYTTYKLETNFGCSTVGEYGTNGTTTADLVSEIDLPDGSKYSFTYEPTPAHSGYVTGRLASIRLPTGGTVSYAYTGGNGGINCADGSAATITRTTPDGTWTYAQIKGTGAASATIVTAPKFSYDSAADQKIIQFQGIYETQRNTYQGSGPTITSLPISESTLQTASLLKETQICYNGSASPCTTTSISTTTPFSQRTITNILPGSANNVSQSIFKYNGSGSLTEQDDYDYGSGSPGALLKKTAITYASLGNVTASRQTVTVTNGTGGTVSQLQYNYDETSVVATSGTPQLTSVTGPRGNLTSTYYYTVGSSFLKKSMTYFDTGNVQTVTDLNGAQTTTSYGACGNSFPTSVNEPLGLSRSMTWNCTGGVLTSVTDENGRISSSAYTRDPYFWRPESTSDPSGALTNFTYIGQTQTETDLTVVSGSSAVDVLATRDSLGRASLLQKRQSPGSSSFDSEETDYDSNGGVYKNTIPFVSTAGITNPSATGKMYQFDALGRPTLSTDSGGGTLTQLYPQNDELVTKGPAPTGENNKQRQLEFDGLGRLKSVCEITSTGGSGSCGQTNSKTGFWTKYNIQMTP